METEILKTLGEIAGIAGLALGVFFLLVRTILKKDIFPRLARKQAFNILHKIIVLAFTIGIIGIGSWLISDLFKTSLLKQDFTKVIVEDGRIIAEKEKGKIIALDLGSCIGDSLLFGPPEIFHRITIDVINLFDRPVSLLEHHVESKIDGKEIRGYKYKVDYLSALKPSETARLNIEAHLITDRIREHLRKFDTPDYGITEEVVIITSEGRLPPIPVRSISQPCLEGSAKPSEKEE